MVAGDPQAIRVQGVTTLRVSSDSGRVTVVAEDRADVLVSRGVVAVDQADPHRVRVAGANGPVEARVPHGTHVVVGAGSGRVQLRGPLGAVSVTADSGRVVIDQADQVDVRVKSGRVEIGRCEGLCRVTSRSGRTRIGSSGPTEVMVDSGAIEALEIRGAAHLRTTSGRIDVEMAGPFDVDAESVSGRIRVSVPPDEHPEVDLTSTGRTNVGVEVGTDATIRARSVSGRLEVVVGRDR